MAYHILSARRHQIWVITCLSLPPSLSHTQHEGVVVRLGSAAPSIALAARCGGAVYCTRGSVLRRRLLHSHRRQSHFRCRRRRLQHTYFLVSVRCFSEEKVWFAVSVHSRRRLLRLRRRYRRKYAKVIQLNRVSIIYKQMAAVNFLHFYFMKWFVKIDRKVTSNIQFKKYKL
jgi:hypothetical protein